MALNVADVSIFPCNFIGITVQQLWEMSHYWAQSKSIRGKTLRHASYVYCAVFHPNQKQRPLVVTGAEDGGIRMWHRDTGEMLAVLKVRRALEVVYLCVCTCKCVDVALLVFLCVPPSVKGYVGVGMKRSGQASSIRQVVGLCMQ